MTKHAPEDAVVKCHMPLEEGTKIIEDAAKMMDITSLVVCSAQVNPAPEGKPKLAIKARVYSLRSRLGRVMQRLYNLESSNEPEKPLDIDLDLYQMENY